MKTVLDLGCGRGGWTRAFLDVGWHVIGVDVKHYPDYPSEAEFIERDMRTLERDSLCGIDLVVSSPPCNEFSRLDAKALFPNDPLPDMSLVQCSFDLASAINRPLVLENVRGLQLMIGPAVQHYGSFYLWGDGVPSLMPYIAGRAGRYKQKWQFRSPSKRAIIPYELARWVANYHSGRTPVRTSQGGTLVVNPFPCSLPPCPARRARTTAAVRAPQEVPASHLQEVLF